MTVLNGKDTVPNGSGSCARNITQFLQSNAALSSRHHIFLCDCHCKIFHENKFPHGFIWFVTPAGDPDRFHTQAGRSSFELIPWSLEFQHLDALMLRDFQPLQEVDRVDLKSRVGLPFWRSLPKAWKTVLATNYRESSLKLLLFGLLKASASPRDCFPGGTLVNFYNGCWRIKRTGLLWNTRWNQLRLSKSISSLIIHSEFSRRGARVCENLHQSRFHTPPSFSLGSENKQFVVVFYFYQTLAWQLLWAPWASTCNRSHLELISQNSQSSAEEPGNTTNPFALQ